MLEIRRSEVRIPVLVQVFLLRSYNKSYYVISLQDEYRIWKKKIVLAWRQIVEISKTTCISSISQIYFFNSCVFACQSFYTILNFPWLHNNLFAMGSAFFRYFQIQELLYTNRMTSFVLYLFWWGGHCCPMHCDLLRSITRSWICWLNFAQRPIFSGMRLFNKPEISDSEQPA